MKAVKILLVGLLLLSFCVLPVSAGISEPPVWTYSKVVNWNFESWSSGSSNVAPDGWTIDGSAYSSLGRSSDSKVSDYSYFITSNGATTAVLYQTVSVTPGYYSIGAWVKAKNCTSGTLNIDLYNSSGIDTGGVSLTGNSDWVYQEVKVYVNYTGTLNLRVFANGSPNSGATFYVDGLVLKLTSATASSPSVIYTEEYMNVSISYTPSAVYSNSTLHIYLPSKTSYYDDVGKLGTPTAIVDDSSSVSAYRAEGVGKDEKAYAYINVSGLSAATHYILLSIPLNQPPDITYPTNGTIIASAYPDYNEVTLTWENCSETYYGVISKYSDFSTVWYESTLYSADWNVTLDSGTYHWKVQAYDSLHDQYSNFSYGYFEIGKASSDPGYIRIYAVNESTNKNLTSFSVSLYNDSVFLNKSTTSGYIEFTSSEVVTGEYTAKIYANNYSARYRIINSPDTITAVLAPDSNTSLLVFSMIDYSGQFEYSNTQLVVTKPSSSGSIIISDSYFDAAGANKVYLITGEDYDLTLKSDNAEKSVGPYVVAGSATVSLVVGEIALVPESTLYGGFNYSLTKTNTSVAFSWIAPAGSLNEPFTYNITNSTGKTVYSLTSIAPKGTATFTYPDPEAQYKIRIYANTTGGTFSHSEYVSGETNLVDLQISDKWYNMISIFGIFIVALTFGYRSASAGAFITSLFAGGLYAIGLLKVDVLILSLCIILGLLAILRGRGA